MTYSLAVKKFDCLCNLQTKASQVVVRICRGTKQAERYIWAKNRIYKGDMVPIRPMDLEVVQWEANGLCAIAFRYMLVVNSFELVYSELGAIIAGCLGRQNLQSNIFRCLFCLSIPTEPHISKAAVAKLMNNTVSPVISIYIAQLNRMVATRLVVIDML
jgi:hypothetical protein